MNAIACCVLFVHLAAGAALAQTYDDVQIRLGPYEQRENGGDTPLNVWRSTGAVVIGSETHSTFSLADSCEAFSVSSAKSDIRGDATAAWQIDVTPIRVVKDAVTFRMRWSRLEGVRQAMKRLATGEARPQPLSGDL